MKYLLYFLFHSSLKLRSTNFCHTGKPLCKRRNKSNSSEPNNKLASRESAPSRLYFLTDIVHGQHDIITYFLYFAHQISSNRMTCALKKYAYNENPTSFVFRLDHHNSLDMNFLGYFLFRLKDQV